jgi:hypothetical protein
LALALILQTCNCQYILSNGLGYGGLITTGAVAAPFLVQAPSYAYAPIARPTFAIRAPAPVIAAPAPVVAAPAPAPIIVEAAPKQIIAAPAPAPAPVVLAAPRPVIEENYGPAEPYNYGYQTTDEQGNSVTRQEVSDGNGAVRGSYSYTDIQVYDLILIFLVSIFFSHYHKRTVILVILMKVKAICSFKIFQSLFM